MLLPSFNTQITELSLMQSRWASILNPVLSNPILDGQILPNVVLAPGDNTINHRLGRKLQGWTIVRKRANSDIFDKQDSNTQQGLTLILNSSGAVTLDLYVF